MNMFQISAAQMLCAYLNNICTHFDLTLFMLIYVTSLAKTSFNNQVLCRVQNEAMMQCHCFEESN